MIAIPLDAMLKKVVLDIFTCRGCNGEGKVQNPYFEVCMRDEDWEDWDCDSCYYHDGCGGEVITCPDCNGEGYERLDWKEFLRRLMEDADDT